MARTALGWLNMLMPKDRYAHVETDIAYGDHARHRLDVYYPKPASGPNPVLFFVYGGGWSDGARQEYEFVGRAFAAAGFVTVVPDYRLVPEVHFPQFLEDLAHALQWLQREAHRFSGDVERLFLMGHSAGAYNAMMLGLDGQRHGAPDLKGQLRGIVGLSGPYDFYPYDVAASINTFSRAPQPKLTQPVYLVDEYAPHVMLAHGKPDTVCGVYNSQNLAYCLRAAGITTVEHYYARAGHPDTLLSLFPWLRWRFPVYQQALDFMRSRL